MENLYMGKGLLFQFFCCGPFSLTSDVCTTLGLPTKWACPPTPALHLGGGVVAGEAEEDMKRRRRRRRKGLIFFFLNGNSGVRRRPDLVGLLWVFFWVFFYNFLGGPELVFFFFFKVQRLPDQSLTFAHAAHATTARPATQVCFLLY